MADGNIVISKNFIAIVTIAFILISATATSVAYAMGVTSTVDNIQNKVGTLEVQLDTNQLKTIANDKDIAVIKEKLTSIDNNIRELKEILKEQNQ